MTDAPRWAAAYNAVCQALPPDRIEFDATKASHLWARLPRKRDFRGALLKVPGPGVHWMVPLGHAYCCGGGTVSHNDPFSGLLEIAKDVTGEMSRYLWTALMCGAESIYGLSQWLPTKLEPVDTFCEVERTHDASRLGGNRIDAAGRRLPECIEEALNAAHQEGSRRIPDAIVTSFKAFEPIKNVPGIEWGHYMFEGPKPHSVRFVYAQMSLPLGPVQIWPERFISDDRAYVLSLPTWTLVTNGPAPALDGIQHDRLCMSFHGNLVCSHPGANAVIYNIGS